MAILIITDGEATIITLTPIIITHFTPEATIMIRGMEEITITTILTSMIRTIRIIFTTADTTTGITMVSITDTIQAEIITAGIREVIITTAIQEEATAITQKESLRISQELLSVLLPILIPIQIPAVQDRILRKPLLRPVTRTTTSIMPRHLREAITVAEVRITITGETITALIVPVEIITTTAIQVVEATQVNQLPRQLLPVEDRPIRNSNK